MLDELLGQVHGWLEQEPACSAQQVLDRLIAIQPDLFTTVQRAVRAWRGERARKVISEVLGKIAPPAGASAAAGAPAGEPALTTSA